MLGFFQEQTPEPAEEAGFFSPEENQIPSKIAGFIDSVNIAESLNDDDLILIGRRCCQGYQVDEESRKPWLEQTKGAIELASQVKQEKTFPWRGAANIKLPIITDAAIKFAARAYSEIIRDNQVVKAKVLGDDPQETKAKRAERVSDYMSWQLMEKETEWEADTDKLLHILPIVGHLFRKRYYCTAEKRTKSELCLPDSVCVNSGVSSLGSARRVTHIIKNITQNEVVGNQRAGVWRKVELRDKEGPDKKTDYLKDDDYYCLYEQFCWLDLDEDGFEEPYIVTVEKESTKVLRIVAGYDKDDVEVNDSGEVMAIKPKSIFTDYIFIPSLDGGYYGIGFGQMLEPLTRTANTLVNQLADSGSLNNIQGGYLSKEVKIRSGNQRFELGEWKRTDATAEQLRGGVFPLPTKEPSPTLFNLLGLIMDLTKDLASVKDVLSGDAPGANVPATTVMALIEQGMKTFNAIYKRIYRSLKNEYRQLYNLNYEYLDEQEYYKVVEEKREILRDDFKSDDIDILPVADPNMSTDIQRLARAEALKGAIGMPGVDSKPIAKQWLEAMRTPDHLIDEILPEQDPNGVPPELQKMMQDVEMKMADVANKEQEIDIQKQLLSLKERELEYKSFEIVTKAIKNLADAEAQEAGSQMAVYKQISDMILNDVKTKAEMNSQQPKEVEAWSQKTTGINGQQAQ
jgi:chaperonin GroES